MAKKEIGEYDDEKCYLICYLNFHGLLGNLSAVACIHVCISSVVVHQRVAGGKDWRGVDRTGCFFWNS